MADAPDHEIEITPEMIEAGVDAFYSLAVDENWEMRPGAYAVISRVLEVCLRSRKIYPL